jgi:hypothetical protein
MIMGREWGEHYCTNKFQKQQSLGLMLIFKIWVGKDRVSLTNYIKYNESEKGRDLALFCRVAETRPNTFSFIYPNNKKKYTLVMPPFSTLLQSCYIR